MMSLGLLMWRMIQLISAQQAGLTMEVLLSRGIREDLR